MHEISRRKFGTMLLGGAGAVAVGGLTTLRLTGSDGRAVHAFDVHHDRSVYVTMTSGSEFVVEVKQLDSGEVLERHDRVTAYNLLGLDSDHVTFVALA